jgi:membrane associated rhomboid family serine protease
MSASLRLRPTAAMLAIAVACCAIEGVLQAADHGWIGSARWRSLAYQNAGFWAGLLRDWRPNYAAQPYLMFLTYSGLHGGFGHLLGNMVALFALGPLVAARTGERGFLALWLVSVLGGAAAFGILSQSPQPMVGASGALFGLAGAWKAWDWQEARRSGAPVWPILLWVAGLAALNLVLWVIEDGLLAWETHLGGFAAGWAWAIWAGRATEKPAGVSPGGR